MRITCDLSADAAYIYLMPIKSGEATKTCPCVPSEMDGMINLILMRRISWLVLKFKEPAFAFLQSS